MENDKIKIIDKKIIELKKERRRLVEYYRVNNSKNKHPDLFNKKQKV